MKTHKNILTIIFILTLTLTGSYLLQAGKNYTFPHSDKRDTLFVEFSGKIYDNLTKKSISFVSITIKGTNIGTVTNSEGEFIIKISPLYSNESLEISSLGYKTLNVSIGLLRETENEIFLEPTSYYLEEVEIRKLDPVNLIRDVLKNIPQNYGNEAFMLTAFYREAIRQNRNYVAISEAVFDVYKSGYGKAFDNDRIKIFKGRKSQDVTRMDTILFKLQGGPYYIFLLDVARHPGDILSGDVLDYYNFELGGIVTIDQRNAYVVAFDQKNNITLPLYKGNIFIDVDTKAIIAMEFSLSEIAIDKAADFMIVKKPSNMKVDVDSISNTLPFSNPLEIAKRKSLDFMVYSSLSLMLLSEGRCYVSQLQGKLQKYR